MIYGVRPKMQMTGAQRSGNGKKTLKQTLLSLRRLNERDEPRASVISCVFYTRPQQSSKWDAPSESRETHFQISAGHRKCFSIMCHREKPTNRRWQSQSP